MPGKKAPGFWFDSKDWRATALAPLGMAYGAVAARRMLNASPATVDAPVICVGNFTVGGTGKTPTVIALAEAAKAKGFTPGLLVRGYGGRSGQVQLADLAKHTASDLGDEAMLLARAAMTAVGADRHAAAQLLLEQGADLLIMDDGFQSRRLHAEFSLITVDARRGFGNERAVPAGPLRAPLRVQMAMADMVLKIGTSDGEAGDRALRLAARAAKPTATAVMEPVKAKTLLKRKMIAFCGIGDPQKFFDTLRTHGADVVHAQGFGDHHDYTELDARGLLDAADRKKLTLVTTEKDAVRLAAHASGARAALAARVQVLRAALRFENPALPAQIITQAVSENRARRVAL